MVNAIAAFSGASQTGPTGARGAELLRAQALANVQSTRERGSVRDEDASPSRGLAGAAENSEGPAAIVELSAAARSAVAGLDGEESAAGQPDGDPGVAEQLEESNDEAGASADDEELSSEEQEMVRELKDRDREVRAHENAHASVGGAYAGSPTYTYQTGPDGARYAVGGEVQIDISEVPNDPEKTIEKMRVVQAAAMAPAEPSAADRQVAAQAAGKAAEAQAELNAQASAKLSGEGDSDSGKAPAGSDEASVQRSQARQLAEYRYTPPAPGQLLDAAA